MMVTALSPLQNFFGYGDVKATENYLNVMNRLGGVVKSRWMSFRAHRSLNVN